MNRYGFTKKRLEPPKLLTFISDYSPRAKEGTKARADMLSVGSSGVPFMYRIVGLWIIPRWFSRDWFRETASDKGMRRAKQMKEAARHV